MTSKEALKLLYSDAENYAYFNETEEDLSEIKAEYELIKQDLDRLEQLEDNIKIHKETIKMQHNQIEKLKEKNKKLKDKVYNYQLCANITEPFHKLNKMKLKQLEKVIEILKSKKVNIFHLYVFDTYEQYKEHYPFAEYNNKKDMLNKKEYKLLKEYLDD